MLKQFAALLTLLFSLQSVADVAGEKPVRMPWVDTNISSNGLALTPSKEPSFGEFILPETQNALPWGKEIVGRYKKDMPSEASDPGYDMHVFISKSIPEGALRQLFKQAKDFRPGSIRFVLRGFTPQQIGPLISHFRRLFPDPYTDDFIIEIDPRHFRDYQVTTVPTYLVKDQGKWFDVRGMASLHGVVENVKKRGLQIQGESYSIEEPDILAVIQDRAQKFDWESAMARAKGRVARNLSPTFDLPTVKEDAQSFFTPTFTVPHDIEVPATEKSPKQLLAAAGTQIRILDHTRLPTPIIVIDANDERQVAMLKHWHQGEFAKADVFVIGAYQEGQEAPNYMTLSTVLKKTVRPWQKKMTESFGVDAVPAIVDQVGDQLRVRYVKPRS